MKTALKKPCRLPTGEISKIAGRSALTPPLPVRRCTLPRTANAATVQPGFAKVSTLLAVALTLTGGNVLAISTSSAPVKDTVTQTATLVANPAAPAKAAAGPRTVTPSAPMSSSTVPVSIEEDIRDI